MSAPRPTLLAAAAVMVGLLSWACSPEASDPVRGEAETTVDGASLLQRAAAEADHGRDNKAGQLYAKALELYSRNGDLPGQGRALLGIATVARNTGQGEVARAKYKAALEVFLSAGDELGQADVHLALGELDRSRFNDTAALSQISTAARMFREQGRYASEVTAQLGISDLERRAGRILAARRAAGRADILSTLLRDESSAETARRALAYLGRQPDEYELMRLRLRAELGQERAPGPLLIATTSLNLGLVEALAAELAAARRELKIAAENFVLAGRHAQAARAWLALANMELAADQPDAAAAALKSAKAEFDQSGDAAEMLPEVAAELSIGLAEVAARNGESIGDGFVAARRLADASGSADLIATAVLVEAHAHLRAARLEDAAAVLSSVVPAVLGGQTKGRVALARGDMRAARSEPSAAATEYTAAVDAFVAANDRLWEGIARARLAAALGAAGETTEAWVQAQLASRILKMAGPDDRSMQLLGEPRPTIQRQ